VGAGSLWPVPTSVGDSLNFKPEPLDPVPHINGNGNLVDFSKK